METKVGVGESKKLDSFDAGVEAARVAFNKVGTIPVVSAESFMQINCKEAKNSN